MPLYRVELVREITAYVRADTPEAANAWAERNAEDIAETEDMQTHWDVYTEAVAVSDADKMRGNWNGDCLCYGSHSGDITCAEAIQE